MPETGIFDDIAELSHHRYSERLLPKGKARDMGFFSGSQFNLSISLRYTPVAGEMDFWCALLQQVSRIIHDTTDGSQSIGRVLLSINSMGGQDADIWIHPNSDVWSNSSGARLWFPFESLDVPQDHMFYPTILAHELGHYLYDLRDEYNNGSECVGDITQQASLMEGYGWDNYTQWVDAANNPYPNFLAFFPDFDGGVAVLQVGEPSEYCHDGNHDATADHNQNNINGGQSCWTYIANDANHNNIPYGLTAPGPGGPALTAPAFPADVVCTQLIPVQRFMLVLDRSGSMLGPKIEQLRVGANFWVDYVNSGEELGMVTFAGSETLDLSMSAVPAPGPAQTDWRTGRHTTVDAINAGGQTAIGDALRAGLNDILAGGRASSQVMILFTDGLQNAGSETAEEVLPDLVSGGVRVYTIGLGTDQDATLLANVATTTGASYFPIDGDLPPDEAANAITEALVQVAGQSRENGGIVSFNPVDGASPDESSADGAPPFDWRFERVEPTSKPRPRRSFTFSVNVTPGSTHATLGAMWKDNKLRFAVNLTDPDGNVVSAGPGVRHVAGDYPYSFYEIDNPASGTWKVKVSGGDLANTRFRTIGFEVNNAISLDASLVKPHVRLGADIEVRARLKAPFAVPGARMTGWTLSPAGRWSRYEFTEHTGERGDPYEPYTYTAKVSTKEGPGQYLIVVDAYREEGSFVVELDELYRRRPGVKPEDVRREVEVPEISRRAVLAATVDRKGPDEDEPIPGHNPQPPYIPKNHERNLQRWKKAHRVR